MDIGPLLALPSRPFASTTTVDVGPERGTPVIPAMNVAAWIAGSPIRIVSDSPAMPRLPMSMLFSPVLRLAPADAPTAMLLLPVVFLERAAAPTAVLSSPSLLNNSAAAPLAVLLFPALKRTAPAPVAVLKPPSVLLKSENQPTAVFAGPVVRF